MKLFERVARALRADWVAYSAIALVSLLQLCIALQPLSYLLSDILPDDAFYYFEIARHIVIGEGSTFDGVHPTNGYHPLWMLVLLPIFSWFSSGAVGATEPIYAALALSAFISAAAGCVTLRILSRITDNPLARAVAVFALMASPLWLFETINGLETSLAMLLVVAFFLFALRAQEQPSYARYALAGALAGLMVLARMDMAVYALAFAAFLLWRHGIRIGMLRAAVVGGSALLVASPWFLWNYATFGMLLTSAANGNVIINHALVVQDNGPGIITLVKGIAYMLVYHATATLERGGLLVPLGALAGAALGLYGAGLWKVRDVLRARALLVAFALGFVALFVVNAGLRFTGRTWYFVSANFFFVFALAGLAGSLLERAARPRIAAALVAGALALSFALAWHEHIRAQSANQLEMLAMASWMDEHLPEDAVVGVFNAGVQGYFSRVQVVNLDGLVNNTAYEAIRDRRLWSYIREEGIGYISDFDLYLSYRYRPFLDTDDVFSQLAERHRIELLPGSRLEGGIVLREVTP